MRTYSILVGKCYRTTSGEVREVCGYRDGEVTYTTHPTDESSNGRFTIRLSWEHFAREAESEAPCPKT